MKKYYCQKISDYKKDQGKIKVGENDVYSVEELKLWVRS